MYKFIVVALLALANCAHACDMCNVFLGINPNDVKHSITLMHRHRSYQGLISAEMINSFGGAQKTAHGGSHIVEDVEVKEVYNTYELQGKFFIAPKIQLVSTIGLSSNFIMENQILAARSTGISDLLLLGRYQIYNSMSYGDVKFAQRLLLGTGIKLPMGRFSDMDGLTYDPYLQAGTGSVDGMLNLNYVCKLNGFGANLDFNYKINSFNQFQFRLANRLNFAAQTFAQLNIKAITLMPVLGIYYEQANRDFLNEIVIFGSGGKVLLLNWGLNIFIPNASINLTYQSPILEGLLDIQIPNKERVMIGITYYFSSN